jgi:hypothetical protein
LGNGSGRGGDAGGLESDAGGGFLLSCELRINGYCEIKKFWIMNIKQSTG